MTERNLNIPAIIPSAEKEEAVLQAHRQITTSTLEEHPTPVAIGAEAPPSSVSLELSGAGPFGAY
jgi:hypothetical protein